jgi:hypothetical protein
MSGLTRSDLFDAAVGASVAAALVVITSQIDVADDERGLDAYEVMSRNIIRETLTTQTGEPVDRIIFHCVSVR